MLRSIFFLISFFAVHALFSQSFVSIWNTNTTSSGSSGVNEISIPTNPAYTNYNYSVDWGDGNTDININGNITHTYAAPGIYTLTISGTFPSIYFNNTGDRNKIIEILDWGNIQWQTMEAAFYGCENLNFDAIDSPDLSQVTSLKNMFRDCDSFNGIVNNWDVNNITDISGLFRDAQIFNRPLDNWNTISVTDMSHTFDGALNFNEPLDNWNTASVTTLERTFSRATSFNQNINSWDTSQVTNMRGTFYTTPSFDQPLNNWNVTNVTLMDDMFYNSSFNRPIGNWNVANVTDMSGMFAQSKFNQPLATWNVGNVTDMSFMFFRHRTFDQPLDNWNVSQVTNMESMFDGWIWNGIFNQPLNSWNVDNVTNMRYMFRDNAFFNQPLDNWNVDNVVNMEGMFENTVAFNQDIGMWNVGNVTNMRSMFHQAVSFNMPLTNWDVSQVTNMASMLTNVPLFNQDITSWNVSAVTDMNLMFSGATAFDQDLSSWNLGQVTNMESMFKDAINFNQSLETWNISNVTNMTFMLDGSGISQANYDSTLMSWATQSVNNNITLGATDLTYCDGLTARDSLINDHNWSFTGDSVNCSYVLCTAITSPQNGDDQVPANSDIRWEPTPNATGYKVSIRRENGGTTQVIYDQEDVGNVEGIDFTNEFTAGDTVFVTVVPYNDEGDAVGCPEISFTVMESWANSPDAFKLTYDTTVTSGTTTLANQLKIEANTGYPSYLTYDYSIDWGDGQYDNHVTSTITHTYMVPGEYTVAIIGSFPAPFHYYSNSDAIKLQSIDQWGTQLWQSMELAFYGCSNMTYNATDVPNLSQVTTMANMFGSCSMFNGNINNWDVSNVTNMYGTFLAATEFNQPLNNWDVSNVTNFGATFLVASAFDQDLNNWDVGSATTMSRMFEQAEVFNQPLDNWNVSQVTDMSGMFNRAVAFNQPLNEWDVDNVTDMSQMFNGLVYDMSFNQPLDNWNVSNVTDMSEMFQRCIVFDQPLNSWNVENVTNMTSMFNRAWRFDHPLNNWDVSRVTNMATMFSGATDFNQNINTWNVTNVINMQGMFNSATTFDQPLGNWNVNSVVNMANMFRNTDNFNQPLNTWNVSAVANMTSMFEDAIAFDQPLDQWDVSSVTLMGSMFEAAPLFNQPINSWDVGVVTQMEAMFKEAELFNQPLNNWDTGEVMNTREMFNGATAFNQPLDQWNTSFVTTMQEMFQNATSFDQPLNGWNVASVTNMQGMFQGATAFNGAIGSWNVRKVTNMEYMFSGATSFNQELNNWRVSSVQNMDHMFQNASNFNQPLNQWDLGAVSMLGTFSDATAFDQDLGAWNVSNVSSMQNMLDNTALTRENYDNTLIAWSEQNLNPGITLGAAGLLYCDAQQERQSMIDTYGWSIDSDTLDCPIPECTELSSPMNGDVDVPVNTNLTWAPVLYANGYRVTVRVEPGNITLVNNEVVYDVSYTFPNDFNGGESVYVTVVPFNDEGDAMGCTEENFTVAALPASVPDCTTLTIPFNNTTDIPVDTDLFWGGIPNADGYRLTMGTSMGGNDLLDAEDVGNVTTYELITPLPEDTEIYVSIVPYNEEGEAIGCTSESFTTALIPVPPVCTTMVSPAPGQTGVSVDTDITWNPVDSATGYLITVGTTQGGIEIANSIDVGNQTVYDFPDDLNENRTYYVTITPYNDVGDANDCPEQSFRTGSTAVSVPACTTLASPANGSTAVAVDITSISWNAVANATGYRISINGSASNANNVSDLVVNGTTHPLTNNFNNGETVTVLVVPFNANGDAMGCSPESFTIVNVTPEPPVCTTLANPTNGSTNVAVDIASISWNAVDNATGYRISIDGSTSNANDVTNLVVNETSHTLTNNFANGETVTVFIVPFNADGDAMGCNSESFTTIEIQNSVPECTSLINPVDQSLDVAVGTAISWNTAANATGYLINIGTSSGGTDIANAVDVTNGTTYNLTENLPFNTEIFVSIIPYNAEGSALGCAEERFITEEESVPFLPNCTTINLPDNGATNISVSTQIRWNAVGNVDGYILNLGTTEGGSDILGNEDVGLATSYQLLQDLPYDQEIFVSILPYGPNGQAENCIPQSFTTVAEPEEQVESMYGFSPNGDGINDHWEIEGITSSPNNTVQIYNRWGDLVFEINGYDNNNNVFRGLANRKTQMGGNQLPSGTYFFNIQVSGAHNLKKLQGFLVLKR
jgi:gliding motility-associated-like protein